MKAKFSDIAWLVFSCLPSGPEKWEVVAKTAISGLLGKPSEHREKLISFWQEEASELLGKGMYEKKPLQLSPRALTESRFWPTTVPTVLLQSVINISLEELENSLELQAKATIRRNRLVGLPSDVPIIRLLGLGIKPSPNFWWDVVTFAARATASPNAKFHCSEGVVLMLMEAIGVPPDFQKRCIERDYDDFSEYDSDGDPIFQKRIMGHWHSVPLSWCLVKAGYVKALLKLFERRSETRRKETGYAVWKKHKKKKGRSARGKKSPRHGEDLLTAALTSNNPLDVRMGMCKILLERGASPNAKTEKSYITGTRSPLMMAAKLGCLEACALMLEYGGDPLGGTSAYTEAVYFEQEHVVELFDAWKLSLCSTEKEVKQWNGRRADLRANAQPNIWPKRRKKKMFRLTTEARQEKEAAVAKLIESAERAVYPASKRKKEILKVSCPLCALSKTPGTRTFEPAALQDHILVSARHHPFSYSLTVELRRRRHS